MPRRKTVMIQVEDILPPPVSAKTVTENDDVIFPSILPRYTVADRFLNSIWGVRLPLIGTALLVLTAIIGLAL